MKKRRNDSLKTRQKHKLPQKDFSQTMRVSLLREQFDKFGNISVRQDKLIRFFGATADICYSRKTPPYSPAADSLFL